MAGFRDAVGRFRGRQAQASEASEAIEADELAAVEELAEIENDPLPQSPASLHTLLRGARTAGSPAPVRQCRGGDRRRQRDHALVVGLEAAQARIDADYAEAPARERARLLDLWQRVHGPRLETARARRDKAAVELCQAIGDCAESRIRWPGSPTRSAIASRSARSRGRSPPTCCKIGSGPISSGSARRRRERHERRSRNGNTIRRACAPQIRPGAVAVQRR